MPHSITKSWLSIAEAQEIIDKLINSLTRTFSPSPHITKLITDYHHNNHQISSLEELPDGSFNSCFLATIPAPTPTPGGRSDGIPPTALAAGDLKLVIKVSPPPYVRVLRYETNILNAEATILRLIKARTTVPVPEVLEYNDKCDIIDSPYLVMEYIPGVALDKLRSSSTTLSPSILSTLDHQVTSYLRQINSISGPAFGLVSKYSQKYTSRREFFLGTTESVLGDGEDMLVLLPYAHIRTQVRRCSYVLDQGDEEEEQLLGGRNTGGDRGGRLEPLLSMMDFWDGNVIVDIGGDGGGGNCGGSGDGRSKPPRIAGFIDFERAAWGDPLCQKGVLLNEPPSTTWGSSINANGTGARPESSRRKCKRLLYLTQLSTIKIIQSYYRQLGDTENEMYWRKTLMECLQGLSAWVDPLKERRVGGAGKGGGGDILMGMKFC